MKYNVTFSCGHAAEVQLFGHNKDRERTIKWYEESALCSECYKKQQRERDKELAAKHNLPEITGVSDKQIAYADSLRSSYLRAFDDELDKLAKMLDELRTERRAELDAMLTERGQSEAEFLDQCMREIGMIKAYTVLTTGDARRIIDTLK